MNETSKKRLIEIAREAVGAAVRGERAPEPEESDPDLQVAAGAFVTLRTQGRLRGCLGRFESDQPVYRTVNEMAGAAAMSDPRFVLDRVQPSEVEDLDIHVSVLSPLRRIKDPLDFELGKHGIYIRRAGRSGCFLPEVATETGWTKEAFLTHCARDKAGMAPDAWKDPGTEVLVFTTEGVSG